MATGGAADREDAALRQRLRAAVHFVVGELASEQGDGTVRRPTWLAASCTLTPCGPFPAEHHVRFSRQFVAALTETTLKQFGGSPGVPGEHSLAASYPGPLFAARRQTSRPPIWRRLHSTSVFAEQAWSSAHRALPWSSHAKRQNINEDDVKLLARRQDATVRSSLIAMWHSPHHHVNPPTHLLPNFRRRRTQSDRVAAMATTLHTEAADERARKKRKADGKA